MRIILCNAVCYLCLLFTTNIARNKFDIWERNRDFFLFQDKPHPPYPPNYFLHRPWSKPSRCRSTWNTGHPALFLSVAHRTSADSQRPRTRSFAYEAQTWWLSSPQDLTFKLEWLPLSCLGAHSSGFTSGKNSDRFNLQSQHKLNSRQDYFVWFADGQQVAVIVS